MEKKIEILLRLLKIEFAVAWIIIIGLMTYARSVRLVTEIHIQQPAAEQQVRGGWAGKRST